MPHAIKDLMIDKGSTFRYKFVRKLKETMQPVDMTGYTGRMQIRTSAKATEVLKELTTENGGMTIVGGEITLYMSATDTASITATRPCIYDLEVVAPNSDVTRLVGGHVTWSPEVTR